MSRLKMEEYGVCTIEDLLKVKGRIQKRQLDGLREEIRAKLLIAAEWKLSNPDANAIDDFDEDVYEKLYKNQSRVRFAKEYINLALGKAYHEENLPLFNDVKQDGMLLEEVIKQSKEIIMESTHLRNKCGKFDHDSFLDKAIRHFHTSVGQERDQEIKFVIAGRTQAGKTSVKGVIQSMCGVLKIPLIILTKGVDESIDLHVKLVDLSKGTLMQEKHIVVASSKNDGLGYRLKDALVSEALEGVSHGGTLVIADTKQQVINKACKAIKQFREQVPGGKFLLAVDEADAMFRTSDRHQVFEQALQQLLDLNPSMTVLISATPVPFMLELVDSLDSSEEDIEFFNLDPNYNYVGIEDIKPLEMNGKKIYLDQNELNNRSEFISENETICYANEKVAALYDNALTCATKAKLTNQQSALKNRKGVLVLDCSCPRVYAANNIKDKANAVAQLYKKKEIEIIVITFSGSGIAVKFPSRIVPDAESKQPGMWKSWHNSLIGTLLEYIDEKCGLQVPVFIFAYTKMCRGISFRSTNRVPTHMLMALGRGHNSSTIVQTLGRATFNGRNVLKENGFDCVRVLTTSSDYTVCIKKQNYINEVSQRIQLGDTFAAAVTGANHKIPDSANFLRHTFREVGRIKGMRKQFEDWVDMEDVPKELSPDEEETKEKLWNDNDAQKLLRSLARLRKGHALALAGDIIDDLNEAEHYTIQKRKLRDLLRKFCDKALISKICKEKDPSYKIPPVDRLIPFMNPEQGEIPEMPDGDDASIGEEGDSSPRHQLDHMVSNVSEISSVGSKESPIILDSSDESSLSSISMSADSGYERIKSSTTKVSPEKGEVCMVSVAESFVGRRIAKHFLSDLHFGLVMEFHDDGGLWVIQYDDGDSEDFDKDDLRRALCLYKSHQIYDQTKRKPNARSSSLTNIEHIPMVHETDLSKRNTCIVQLEKKRRVYYTGSGDTPNKIAKTFNVDVCKIICDNKRREGYGSLGKKTPFKFNSPVVLPMTLNDE